MFPTEETICSSSTWNLVVIAPLLLLLRLSCLIRTHNLIRRTHKRHAHSSESIVYFVANQVSLFVNWNSENMNSVQPNQSVCADDGRDLYAEDSSNTTYLEELLHSIVTKLPTIDVKCHHSRVSETDVLRLEQSVDEAKERNRILNYQLFEYFREKDEVNPNFYNFFTEKSWQFWFIKIIGSAADATLTENEDAALKTQRIMRYRELLLQLKSVNSTIQLVTLTIA